MSQDHATLEVAPEKHVSGARKWIITFAICAGILSVMYGVATHRVEVQDEHRQVEMQKDAATPATQPAN